MNAMKQYLEEIRKRAHILALSRNMGEGWVDELFSILLKETKKYPVTSAESFKVLIQVVADKHREYRPVLQPVVKKMEGKLKSREDHLRDLKKPRRTKLPLVTGSIPQVGDILYSSFGYNMTHVTFYRVIKVTPSGKSVTLHKLIPDYVTGGGYTGEVMPTDKLDPDESPIRNKRVSVSGGGYRVKINNYEQASTWGGKPMYYNTMD